MTSGLASVNFAATASSWATWSGPQWVRYEIVTGSWAAAGTDAPATASSAVIPMAPDRSLRIVSAPPW